VILALPLLWLSACDPGEKAPLRSDVEASAARKDAQKTGKPGLGEPVVSGRVWFVSPKDGATVGRKFDVEFGVEGRDVVPASGTERDPKVGHHHIIIDGGPLPDGTVVPKDEKHLHYGDGSTRTTLLLPPGEHELTMQFADGLHQSYGPEWAQTIKVTVTDEAAAPVDGRALAPRPAPAPSPAPAPTPGSPR
jgi:hypothetical protein